jgi:DNA-binding beta-propeller fold protein YncE
VLPITVGKGSPPSDTLGNPVANGNLTYWPLNLPGKSDVIEPTGLDVLKSGAYLYVATYDSTAGANYVFGFSVGSGGALDPAERRRAIWAAAPLQPGPARALFLNAPYVVGTCPAAIASDPTNSYVYVTDEINGPSPRLFGCLRIQAC